MKRLWPSSLVDSDDEPSSSSTGRSSGMPYRGYAARQNKRRKLKTLIDRPEVISSFIERFSHLRFLGNTLPYASLDNAIKLAEPDRNVVQFLQLVPVPDTEVNISDWCMVLPNSVVELNHLDLFNRVPSGLPAEFMDVIVTAATHVSGLLTLPGKLPFPSIGELETVRFIGSKFPGIEYARMGFSCRSESNDIAQLDAESAYIALRSGEVVETHYTRMGGRGKLTTKAKLAAAGHKPIVGRLILMTSQRDLKLNGITEQALTQCYCSGDYPISVGTSWWHGGSEKFLNRFRQYSRYWCFDASKYDASLPGWLVRLAIEIFRDQYEDGHSIEFDAYWNFIYDGLVNAKVFLDNGLVFQRSIGSTSGHNHNTLMQSICTLIVGYASVLSLFDRSLWEEVLYSTWFDALGDDQFGAGKGICAGLGLEIIAGQARSIFGIDWFGDKSFMTDRLIDVTPGEFQGVQYLGKYWRWLCERVNGREFAGLVPYRPFKETILRLVYPERSMSGSPLESYARACGHYMDAAGNSEARQWLEQYLDHLEPMLPDLSFEWDKSFRRRYQGLIDPYAPLPPGRRYSYFEWLCMTLYDRDHCTFLRAGRGSSVSIIDDVSD